ncbi:LysR family transcriptional regulator [Lysobacter sp. HDW10]|uniref:LysR family transcriptional regulator n=1 Tax=Lysobacter sp. HDW10 TaxID=2714936 RepID=UPI00140B3985|nr:LysR family transcriptional regulator [Lysobacter sp. HDW10]QIK80238.1 LysR family transcriptional regulator [Lysobacter sp. HDW10]
MAKRPEIAPRFSYKGSRLKPLKAFCQVARLGSMSRAGEALFLSQPAVSLQIQALEREFGAVLFHRRGRRLELTHEGQLLFDQVAPLVEGFDALHTNFQNALQGSDAGELHIAAGTSTILHLLPPIVSAFKQANPTVRLSLHNVTGAGGLELLRADKVDLAVGSMLDVPNDIRYEPAYTFEPTLIMPVGHPLAELPEITLSDLSPHGLILPPQRLTTYRFVDLVFQRARVPYSVALEVGGWEIIKQYVAMGQGISIVTSICLTPQDRERLVTRSLATYFPSRTYGVVLRKGKYLSPQARAFVDLIKPDALRARDYYHAGHSER